MRRQHEAESKLGQIAICECGFTALLGQGLKLLMQVDCSVPGLISVYDRCPPSAGRPPIALSLQDGSVQAAPLSRTVVLLREAATALSTPS